MFLLFLSFLFLNSLCIVVECDNDSLKTLSKRGIKQELLNNGIEKENEDEKERERKRETETETETETE